MSVHDPRLEYVSALARHTKRDGSLIAFDCGSGLFAEQWAGRPGSLVRAESPELMLALASGASSARRRALCHGPCEPLAAAAAAALGSVIGAPPAVALVGVAPCEPTEPPPAICRRSARSPPSGALSRGRAAGGGRGGHAHGHRRACVHAPPAGLMPDVQRPARRLSPRRCCRCARDGICAYSRRRAAAAPALRAADHLLGQGTFVSVVARARAAALDGQEIIRWARAFGARADRRGARPRRLGRCGMPCAARAAGRRRTVCRRQAARGRRGYSAARRQTRYFCARWRCSSGD